MFICKANRLENDKEVKGFYFQELDGSHYIDFRQSINSSDACDTGIDPSTLTISFDGGESWFSDAKIKIAIVGHKNKMYRNTGVKQ